ncbi:MAG: HNH endonuclease, partial [Deltaproteobacteria bacterium]|nr:HNH endonuclease [Deltaproteobacteria bacterium]
MERRGRQGSAQLRKKYTGLKSPVLLLNRNYQPLRITDAKDAFTLLYVGRGHALDSRFDLLDFERWAAIPPEEGEEWVGTSRGPIRIPRVLVMLRALRSKEFPLRLCRENIFLRDEYACQYCGLRPGIEALNVDHVMPRSRGGTRTWENLVT